jgi:NADH dehydrogenase
MLGGTGFVGRQLASALVQAGCAVRIPTRNRERHRGLLVLPGVELITADIHNEAALRRLLADCDTVINLVGILHDRHRDGRSFQHVHVALVEKLIAASLDTGVSRYLHMSALKANADHGPSHYLRSKGSAERAIKTLAGGGIDYTIFQPSVIFGAGDSFTNLFARLLRAFPVLPLARPEARFAPVYVANVAHAFRAALGDPAAASSKTYQICGPDIMSLREIVAEVARVLGLHRLIIGLPNGLARTQALMMDYLLRGRLFSTDSYKSLAVASVCTENGLAELGVRAASLRVVLPGYLKGAGNQRALSALRQNASR